MEALGLWVLEELVVTADEVDTAVELAAVEVVTGVLVVVDGLVVLVVLLSVRAA